MRKHVWLAALLGVALAGPAWAQSFGGVNPANLSYRPIDTSNSVVPSNTSGGVGLLGFKLGSVFPNRPTSFNSKVIGASAYPSMTSKAWLSAFQYRRGFHP